VICAALHVYAAPMSLDPVISVEELRQLDSVQLFDVRSGPKARASYAEGHLSGAIFADLDTDLAAPAPHPERGGRHPLPDSDVFAAKLGAWGLTPETEVVAYDDQGGMNAAARLWWMLRALGHHRVRVLDGGLQAAMAAGFELTQETKAPGPFAHYPAHPFGAPLADIDEVERARTDPTRLVLDVRAAARYRGEVEPIDPVAGHIPGARNLPLTENLAEGRFKSRAELAAQYTQLLGAVKPSELIVHCGSGVTACHTLLSLERAGLGGAKLYVGSWGEWCRTDRPRAP